MTSYKVSDVVLVKFPFSSLESAKKRPALVLKRTQHTLKIQIATVAMITSKIEGLKLDGDYSIENWKSAGLLHPSLLRLSKVATLDNALIESRLGRLTPSDIENVKRVFQKVFTFWI